MSKTRILWLQPEKGQVSVRRERIADHLGSRGFDITLLDVTPANLLAAARGLSGGKYDVLIGNVRAGLYVGYPLSRLTRTPFIADVSDSISDIDDLPGPVFRSLERYEWWILGRVEEAVYIPAVHRVAEERGCKGRVAPNAVDFETFASPAEDVVERSEDVLTEAGVDLDRPVALYVGVFSRGRNVDVMIDTAAEFPEWQFVFVGEGDLTPVVERAADSTPNVFYPGAFEYDLMPGFMAHATVGFCLVNVERPIKIVEYGAAGLPVLGAPGTLQREFDDDQIYFVEPEADAVADALHRFGSDQDLRERYAENLRADARNHSWDSVADVYESAIRSIVDE